jgi:hypothetical protein
MHQTGRLLETRETDASFNCLDGLTRIWTEQVENLDVLEVHETLQLVYRTQLEHPRKGTGKDKGKGQAFDIVMSQEDLDVARAIEASLGITGCNATTSKEQQVATDVTENISNTGSSEGAEGSKDLGVLKTGETEISCDLEVSIDVPDSIREESLLDQAETETNSQGLYNSGLHPRVLNNCIRYRQVVWIYNSHQCHCHCNGNQPITAGVDHTRN